MREVTELKLTLISFVGYILQFISQKRPERDWRWSFSGFMKIKYMQRSRSCFVEVKAV